MRCPKYLSSILALLGIATVARAEPITSYSELVQVTPESQIVWINEGDLRLNGSTNFDYPITIGFQNSNGVFAGFLDNASASGHPTAASGLWYRTDGTTSGFPDFGTYNHVEARVDWNRNGLFEDSELAQSVNDFGFQALYQGETTRIFPLDVETLEPNSLFLTGLGLTAVLASRKKTKR